MKLITVISGGQTGADLGGLKAAVVLGLNTGGYAPKGFRTERGPAPELADFGLVETFEADYSVRTMMNVHHADVTLWFGRTGTPGYTATRRYCGDRKPFHEQPTFSVLQKIAMHYAIVNVAGNRESKNPGIEQRVIEQLLAAWGPLVA